MDLESRRADSSKNLDFLNSRLKTLQKKRDKWLEMYSDDIITKGQRDAKIDPLDERIEKLEQQRDATEVTPPAPADKGIE